MNENPNLITKDQAAQIATVVTNAAAETIPNKGLNGCGRVYMGIGYGKMNRGSQIAKSLDGVAGIRVTERPNERGVMFYMGYDNAHGAVASRAEHIAKRIKEAGFIAWVDYDAD